MRSAQLGRSRSNYGFTLVELLVVIAIIGVLVGLLLPAVQAAREAARRIQCTNKIKQLALAVQNHTDTHRYMPSGGWGWNWVGDPDRGFGESQPGGWTYSVLPFMEQANIWNMGKGLPDGADKRKLLADMNAIQIADFICPSRRPAVPTGVKPHWTPRNCEKLEFSGKSDYAISVGDTDTADGPDGPTTIAQAENPNYPWLKDDKHPWNGVCDMHSELRLAEIEDGLSQTYLIGDKYLRPEAYEGVGAIGSPMYTTGDNETIFTGFNRDVQRSTKLPPFQDRPSLVLPESFGSAHPGVFNMSMCDGSVQSISFDIDEETHRWLGVRNDGRTVSNSQL
ncbi:DUF1559 domain-containing protein [Bythopirellula polymerisocia]|uniref:DUF1559 domain-containing protein n=1 Tax=Bythopirellula polymerisocia TaxID=2528003 RepID=A0A5C6CRC8_9BACT|nr:DUF1559 domain-containing protein [Bythopirellula polymerisocia]TWU26087.1 hypothetical protein Pla144_33040 [Bythopirellula polymerisocia]